MKNKNTKKAIRIASKISHVDEALLILGAVNQNDLEDWVRHISTQTIRPLHVIVIGDFKLIETLTLSGLYTDFFKVRLDKIALDASSSPRVNMELVYRNILSHFSDTCHIYVDVSKMDSGTTIAVFASLSFAERFFDADIREIFDGMGSINYAFIYYLNSLTNIMEAKNGHDALEALDEFFNL